MEMLICQTCGAILRGKVRGCNTCGSIISKFSPTALPVITQGSQPLTVNVNPDPLVLERVVAKRQMTALLERNGNGHGNGNGNGHGDGNGHGNGDQSWMTAPPGNWGQAPAPEPTELHFGAPAAPAPAPAPEPIPEPVYQPQPQTFQTPMAFMGAPGISPPMPTLIPPPSPEVTPDVAAAVPTAQPFGLQQVAAQPQQEYSAGQYGMAAAAQPEMQAPPEPSQAAPSVASSIPAAMQMFAGAAGVGAGIAAVNAALMGLANAQTEQTPAPAPASSSGAPQPADFFNGAAPAPAEPPSVPAAPADSQASSGVFDFFSTVANQVTQEAAEPSTTDKGSSEYELSDRADFFAQPAAQAAPAPASAGSADMPPVSGDAANAASPASTMPPSAAADAFIPAPAPAPAPAAPAAAPDPGSLDFFAASSPAAPRRDDFPFEEPSKKARVADEFFPDDSPPRAKSDDDDGKPKINKPLGFTPSGKAKDSQEISAELRRASDDDDDDDDDDESSSKSKMAVPPRRNFSGDKPKAMGASSKKSKKDSKDEDADDDAGGTFLSKDVSFLGLTMSRQNQIMLISILTFAGITTVCMLFNALGNFGSLFGQMGQAGGSLFGQQKPALVMAGKWKINCLFNGKKVSGWIDMAQKDTQIYGSGIDSTGPFDFAGNFTPEKIQFNKCYRMFDPNTNKMVPDKPIVFSGKLQPMEQTIYAKGIWYTDRPVGQFLHHRIQRFQGEWEAQWVQALASDGVAGPQPSGNVKAEGMRPPGSPAEIQQFFTYAAFGFLGLGVIILVASLKIFGPGGAMNVWEKQKYIPGQFKPQHNKMVNELAKPLKPGGLPLGRRLEWQAWKFWAPKTLAMPPDMRQSDPHMLILGAGDKGKSRLIASMITHDIESNERAVILIDSDGGLVELITKWVSAHPKAKELAKRVVVLDPTYKGNSLGYNPLEMPDDGDLQAAASSLVYGFKAIYTEPPGSQSQWNAQTANILRNAALLLMANGKTLTDLPTLLNDNDFRDVMLEAVEKKKHEKAEYITLIDTWGQYKKLARTDQWITWVEPILNRVSPMLGDSRIRTILTKPVGDIKLRKFIEDKKVLLVKVAKGQLDENANLLGSLIVTGVKQAALSCANNSSKQNPVALYLDEFDKFIEKETMDSIANETDKFKIAFIGAIKTLQHLPEDFRNQLIINVGTMCCFALAKKDGDMLGPQMFRVDGRKIKHQTLQNFFNKVNTSPQFELISDEEKLNIDRVVGQESRTFFCYRVGTVAGVFHLKSHDFNDIPEGQVKQKLIDKMRGITSATDKEKDKESAA